MIDPDLVWQLLGGPSWLSPRTGQMHRHLVSRARRNLHRPDVATLLANYQTAWQLALDGNQPPEVRNRHRLDAINFGVQLGNRMDQLL